MNDMATEVGKTAGMLSSNFLVGRHVDQQNGKNVWWFTVKASAQRSCWSWIKMEPQALAMAEGARRWK